MEYTETQHEQEPPQQEARFEFERDSPFRKKLLITKPVQIFDENGDEKIIDSVPSIFHVQERGEGWTWLCDREGNFIGKAVSTELMAASEAWNTRMVLRPKTETVKLFASAEDAQANRNPVEISEKDQLLPVIEIGSERTDYIWHIGPAITPKGTVGRGGWVKILAENGDRIFDTGTLSSKDELAKSRSTLDLACIEFEKRIEPSKRGDIKLLLTRLQTTDWELWTGERNRQITPYTLKHAKGTLPGELLLTPLRAVAAKDGEGFQMWLTGLEERERKIDEEMVKINQRKAKAYPFDVGNKKEELFFMAEF